MRKIRTFGGYFEAFINKLTEDVVKKIDFGLSLLKTQQIMPAKFVKYIEDGIFELRIEWEGNIYRIFFIFDNNDVVILFNGFQKKTRKMPKHQINKAKRIKKEYYESQKRLSNKGL